MKNYDPFPTLHEDGSGQTFTEVDLGAEHRLRVTRRHNGRVSLRRYNLEDGRIPQGIELYDDYLVQLVGALGLIATVTAGEPQDE
ncbi:MAG: hypothetical protein ACE37F_25220 [Nannocystaceae bacterium]|nr:hypothetical protein [bacterium]